MRQRYLSALRRPPLPVRQEFTAITVAPWWQTAISGFGLLVSLVLAGMTGYLVWREETRSRIELRSYVGIPQITAQFEGDILNIVLEIGNSGQTPARGLRVRSVMTFDPQIGSVPAAVPTILGGSIGAGEHSTLSYSTSGYDAATMSAIRSGQLRLVLIGEVLYEDVFGETHTTNFKQWWFNATEREQLPTFGPTQDGNTAN